jgi:hypothetical protein
MNDNAREELEKLCQATDKTKRFFRIHAYDRRIARGDDFAGDAWLDKASGRIAYSAVGHDRNVSMGIDQS